jgi:hypothetical protein
MSNAQTEHKGRCEICGNEAEVVVDWNEPKRNCPRCGTYRYISNTGYGGPTAGWLNITQPEHRVMLSGWVREQNDAGDEYTLITMDLSRRVAQKRPPRLQERAARALQTIARRYPDLESSWLLQGFAEDLELQGRSYSVDYASALVLIRLLISRGYLRDHDGLGGISVTGLLEVESLTAASAVSTQGFVAMSFDGGLRDAWTNGFEPAIRAAGFIPLRLDNKDYVGGISDEIIAEIRRSQFVIADYTGQINNVYFEAGFALGLGLIVIPTCRADQFNNLDFDIRHLNTLKWTGPADLAVSLGKRIRAVIGNGPNFQE